MNTNSEFVFDGRNLRNINEPVSQLVEPIELEIQPPTIPVLYDNQEESEVSTLADGEREYLVKGILWRFEMIMVGSALGAILFSILWGLR